MRSLAVPGAWEVTLRPHHDERGTFAEWYSPETVADAAGAPMPVALAGVSVSRKGVIRGVHFVRTPPGQARYVTCVAGEVLDFTVDVREGSPTFGRWDAVRLGPDHWRAVLLSEGLGHAFVALSDRATVLYLCSAPYRPSLENAVHPFDSDPETAERVEAIRAGLPGPVTVLSPQEVVRGGGAWAGAASDPEAVACIQFTSGTTGDPKAVRLTHRNLVVNAGQIAAVHGLDSTSVTLNHLPLFHPMHLNSAVCAGATQVLAPDPDPALAVETANRQAATHFYSLPVRLAHLAADSRLPDLRLRTVGAVFSGGSALLPVPARTLADHFGIPVVQGYGLAETSPLTHCQRPSRPVPGSVGAVVPGTECRLVDIGTGAPVEAGRPGEVQVRGPQVMRGYLGSAATAVDADGWFSTGDVGHQDPAGNLFLTDRLKDVFKCENWVVSPTEIERTLIRHPAVRDCAVVDHPHPYRGAVAHAFVVLASDTEGRTHPESRELADITAYVNQRLPYYQHLRYIDSVDAVPRSPNGKILRRTLRERVGALAPPWRTPVITVINRLTVHGDVPTFEGILKDITAHMSSQPGFLGHRLYRSVRDPHVFIETAQWTDAASHRKAMQADAFQQRVKGLGGLATPEPGLFEIVEEDERV